MSGITGGRKGAQLLRTSAGRTSARRTSGGEPQRGGPQGANLSEADLSRANLRRGNLIRANLNGADLTEAYLAGATLGTADLNGARLTVANLRGAHLERAHLYGANLIGADLREANLTGANLKNAQLNQANLIGAILSGAILSRADLSMANLGATNLSWADLTGANLTGAILHGSMLVRTDLSNAVLTGCRIYGTSAWDVRLSEGTKHQDLVITPLGEPEVTVDNVEVAQFVYLLLHNVKIRDVIDTITTKVVLILGRFAPERKIVLDALRDGLRKRAYVPVVFDFEPPGSRTADETVMLLARMARFVVADISDAKSVLQELRGIVPECPSTPVQPLIVAEQGKRRLQATALSGSVFT